MKKVKGFTLVECLIALAILGIGTLVMAQIYANVNRINMSNHLINTSLANQMKYAESYITESTKGGAIVKEVIADYAVTAAGGVSAPDPSTDAPHKANKLKHVKFESDASRGGTGMVYSYTVDTFILLSRDSADLNSSEVGYKGESEDQYNLRYRYIQIHSNSTP